MTKRLREGKREGKSERKEECGEKRARFEID